MKNYLMSDYALNRYAAGIVYRFSNETVEITQDQYLCANPDKTKDDFLALKELSDSMYREQDRKENAQTRKNISIHALEAMIPSGDIPLTDHLVQMQEKQTASAMISFACESSVFTAVQRRRFYMHFVQGLSHRDIAAIEGVTYHAVSLSLQYALKKIEKHFVKHYAPPPF